MRTLFTERQLEINRLLREGISRAEIASRLGITVQDVSITERRFRENLEKAVNTVNLAKNLSVVSSISLASGTHILDASKMIMNYADSEGIKLKDNTLSVVSGLRGYLGSDLKNGRMKRDVEVLILPDGGLRYL
ncbi:MAG: Tfx family DNA-binding protein [Candidatus Thermoplasmatota archaeon]|nr:Tfx family DNA-binding protein [Candidatus Thermoplasmatota archaeon]